jgi:hypothetical protein
MHPAAEADLDGPRTWTARGDRIVGAALPGRKGATPGSARIVTVPKGWVGHDVPMVTSIPQRTNDRTRAFRRLRTMTIGTALAGVAASAGFGWLAAATDAGQTTQVTVTGSASTTTGSTTTTTSGSTSSGTTSTTSGGRVSSTSGGAQVSTGGS